MKTKKIICDGCHDEIYAKGQDSYGLELRNMVLRCNSNVQTLAYMPPILTEDLHFHHMDCLVTWLEQRKIIKKDTTDVEQ
jgi:hypothetical protein